MLCTQCSRHRRCFLTLESHICFTGDPWNNMNGGKYLRMPLDDKRKLYRCQQNYQVLNELPIWSLFYKIHSRRIAKRIGNKSNKTKHKRMYCLSDFVEFWCVLSWIINRKVWNISNHYFINLDVMNPEIFDVMPELNNKISLWQGDITRLEIDAIVNAGKLCLQ